MSCIKSTGYMDYTQLLLMGTTLYYNVMSTVDLDTCKNQYVATLLTKAATLSLLERNYLNSLAAFYAY